MTTRTLTQLVAARTGGGVQRAHGIRHYGSYDVAQHTWGVLVLYWLLWPDTFGQVVQEIMFHDVPEAWSGDVPAPTKKFSQEVRDALNQIDGSILQRFSFPNVDELSENLRRQVKACDQIELWIWAREQVLDGNRHATCVVRELDAWWEESPLPYRAQLLVSEIRQNVNVLEHATDKIIREITRD